MPSRIAAEEDRDRKYGSGTSFRRIAAGIAAALILTPCGLSGEVSPLPAEEGDFNQDPLRELALAGDVPCQLRLAEEFFFGRNRSANPELAVFWWRKAAEAGSGEAHFNLGIALVHGWGVDLNPALGRKEFQAAAKAGVVSAELQLAEQEYRGYPELRTDGALYPALKADPEGALNRMRELAGRGFLPAHRALASHLDDSTERLKHLPEIRASLQKVAESPEATPDDLLRYGECLRRGEGGVPDMAGAYQLVKQAAENGSPEVKARQGRYLLRGEGVKPDRAAGIRMVREMAAKGVPEAQCELAELYLCSPEFPCDPWKAFELFAAAAGQKYAHGQKRLGDCYLNGIGVTADPRAAFQQYDKAARQGDAGAEVALGLCYKQGLGVGADPVGAFFWFRRAAGRGNQDGIREMGLALMEGRGTTRSVSAGQKMLQYAASQGDAEALEIIRQKGL